MSAKVVPELAIVCSQEKDSVYGINLVGKLLEQQISFAGRTEQKFTRKLPEKLNDFKILLIEDKIFFKICEKKGSEFNRLEKFAKDKFLHVLICSPEERNNRALCVNKFETFIPFVLAMAEVRCGDFSKSLPGPDFKIMLEELIDNLIEFMKNSAGSGCYTEWHLHYFKPAKVLIDSKIKQKELRKHFINAAADFCKSQKRLPKADQVGALFSAMELYDITGDTGASEAMLKLVDDMVLNRPRTTDGLISGTGYNDDPLYLKDFNSWEHWQNTRWDRNSVWTESLHHHGPCFGAAYRYSNNREYLNEVMALVKYIDKVHRDRDDLICHVSVNSKVVSCKWGRGISHALYGVFYLIQELRNDEPEKKYLEDFIRKTFNALIKYQDQHSGLWRNIIDKEYSRLETSCTVCYASVGAACINMNILDKKKFAPMIKKALEGLRKMYWQGGFAGNCTGTGTSSNDETYYLKRPTAWQVMPQMITALLEAAKADIIKI